MHACIYLYMCASRPLPSIFIHFRTEINEYFMHLPTEAEMRRRTRSCASPVGHAPAISAQQPPEHCNLKSINVVCRAITAAQPAVRRATTPHAWASVASLIRLNAHALYWCNVHIRARASPLSDARLRCAPVDWHDEDVPTRTWTTPAERTGTQCCALHIRFGRTCKSIAKISGKTLFVFVHCCSCNRNGYIDYAFEGDLGDGRF